MKFLVSIEVGNQVILDGASHEIMSIDRHSNGIIDIEMRNIYSQEIRVIRFDAGSSLHLEQGILDFVRFVS